MIPEFKRTGKTKLYHYKKISDTKLEFFYTAMSILTFIQKQGFNGGYTIVNDYCRSIKAEKTTMRVESQPGAATQVERKEEHDPKR